MQQYNLRPVSELPRSPSSRSSGSPPNHHTSPPSSHLPPIQHPSNPAQAPLRRPISPSSLPHLDVSNGQTMPPRNYPPPPTGHDLMRLFPPQPPEQPLFLKPGSTSVYFRRQEHQFFAQAGKEIIRVRVESDFPPSGGSRTGKGKEPASISHPWSAHPHPPPPPSSMQPPPEPAHTAHMHSPPHPVPPYPHHHTDVTRAAPGLIGASGAVPPPPGYGPPHHPATIVRNAPPPVDHRVDDIREDDESWRRPTPHGERRRAGKHTKRVVVK
ncbi:hypothetical protein F5148DRAFT_168033 [Russula earlei]|uniref:Uncharacterized protein n=1 Tax=Russula earlei TaxID=71964 RepID=A0ACC0U6E8_9AGAM|nr:hypothetical protein F5148DRAFT_168033 [Russula earlei]